MIVNINLQKYQSSMSPYGYILITPLPPVVVNPRLGGLTSTKLYLGRHEWVEALSPLYLELNLG